MAAVVVSVEKLTGGHLLLKQYSGAANGSIEKVLYIPQTNLAALGLSCSLTANVETFVTTTASLGTPGQDNPVQPGVLPPLRIV